MGTEWQFTWCMEVTCHCEICTIMSAFHLLCVVWCCGWWSYNVAIVLVSMLWLLWQEYIAEASYHVKWNEVGMDLVHCQNQHCRHYLDVLASYSLLSSQKGPQCVLFTQEFGIRTDCKHFSLLKALWMWIGMSMGTGPICAFCFHCVNWKAGKDWQVFRVWCTKDLWLKHGGMSISRFQKDKWSKKHVVKVCSDYTGVDVDDGWA